MKRILTVIGAFLFPLLIVAQQVEFSIQEIRPGQDVDITYTPTGKLAGAEDISAVAYLLQDGNSLPAAQDVALSRGEETFTGTIENNNETVAIFIKFVSGDDIDANGSEGYKAKIYGEDAKPVKGANAAIANVFANFGRIIGLEGDNETAYEYLQKEIELYPDSKDKYLGTWANLARANEDSEALDEIGSRIEEILEKKKPSEEDLQKARMAQLRLGDRQAAQRTLERIVKEFPEGDAAINAKVSEFSRESDLAKKEAIFDAYKDKVPESSRSYMISNLATAYGLDSPEKFEYYSGMLEDKARLAGLYNSIAWSMSGESLEGEAKDLEKAAELSKKSLDLVEAAMKTGEGKYDYLSPSEWVKNQKATYGMYADTYGLIQYKRGEYEDALKYQAYYIRDGYPDADASYRYAVYTERVKGKEAALQIMAKAIREGNSNPKMKEMFTSILASYSPEEGAAQTLAILEAQSREKLKKDMEKIMIDEEAPHFTLKNLKGEEVSLASLKGKTVVLDFWATWCGPCISSFPGMQRAVNKYKGDPSVEFLFIDVWERMDNEKKQEHVQKFIDKKGYTFHVLMDLEDKVVADFGVSGIPTKFVIGPDGNIKFRKVGGGASDKLVDELYSMIELVQEKSTSDQAMSRINE